MKNREGQGEGSSKMSSFQLYEIEVTRARDISFPLNFLQVVNLSFIVPGVDCNCVVYVWPHDGTSP